MAKTFNTAGPCDSSVHYMLPAERRLGEIRPLIQLKAFFVVHAPRQSGKTTSFASLARTLTAEGNLAALHASCKPAASSGADLDRGMSALVRAIDEEARYQLAVELQPAQGPEAFTSIEAELRLRIFLSRWCAACPRPVVLFLDEFDALTDTTLQSVLDQLHSGYTARPAPFPQALALIGLRDVRDYQVGPDGRRLGTSSPFNIKLESLRLRDFTAEEIGELYHQHTAETGQRFSADAVASAYELTKGQPWLVNALARQVVNEFQDRSQEIGPRQIAKAKEMLILRRDTHIDSLVERLREPRVRRVVEPILAGRFLPADTLSDDVQFVQDLGLVTRGKAGLEIANPIYREVVPRALASLSEEDLPVVRAPYITESGRLRFEQVIEGFVSFWRLHAEHFLVRQPYSEAAAQLIFMAWLQRVINGGSPAGVAAIDREYAVGSGRIDICVRWPLASGEVERFVVELKVWRDDRDADPLTQGLDQLADYLDRLELAAGNLMLFDRRPSAPPLPERLHRSDAEHRSRRITIWRL